MAADYTEIRKCVRCGREFTARHVAAQYCSSSCKSMAYRTRQRLELVALRAEKAATSA